MQEACQMLREGHQLYKWAEEGFIVLWATSEARCIDNAYLLSQSQQLDDARQLANSTRSIGYVSTAGKPATAGMLMSCSM